MSSTTFFPFFFTSYMILVRLNVWKKRVHRSRPSWRTQSSWTCFVAVAVRPTTGTVRNRSLRMRSAL